MSRGSRFALAVSALVLAAGLRLWQLDSIPPGLYYDEAGHLLAAQSIGQSGQYPVYFEWGQGNDPLLAYLTAFNMVLLGPVPWAGRLAAAWVGLLSVACTIRAGRELFPRRATGAVAGLVLATLFWHVDLSRYGVQSILAGWLAPASVAAMWSALRSGRLRTYALLGVCLGLGLDAYVAFRVFLLLPALVLLGALWVLPQQRRSILAGGVLAAVVALGIFAPLLVFFIQNPEWFVSRFQATTTQTIGGGNAAVALLANTGRVVWGLFGQGTADQRQNIPGRPALDLIQSTLFAVGGVVSLRHWRRQETLLALWLAIGLLPSILTQDAPSFVRMVMAAPPAALLVALGAEALARQRRLGRVGFSVAAAGLVASAGLNVHDYFWQWAADPVTYKAYDAGLQWIAERLKAAPDTAILYETPVYREWLTFGFTLGPQAYGRFNDFNGRECFVAPAPSARATDYAIVVSEDTQTVPELKRLFPQAVQTGALSVGGAPYAAVYEVPAGAQPLLAPATPQAVRYGDTLELLGDTLPAAPQAAGSQLRLDLFWQMLSPTQADLKRFVHVLGAPRPDGSTLYAQLDSDPCDNAYPTWQWQPGEMMVETVKVDLPSDLPPGSYHVSTGWYDSGSLQRLTATDANGNALGDTIDLGTIQVAGH